MKEDMPAESMTNMPSSGGSKVWMIVAIIAIVALLGLSGFGYMKWQAYRTKTGDLGAEINTLKGRIAAQATDISDKTSVVDSNFMALPELGIKIPVTENLKDLVYGYNQENGYASFTTRDLSYKIGKANNTNPTSLDTGLLGGVKISNTSTDPGCQASCYVSIVKLSNGKFVLYGHPQNVGTDNKTVQAQVMTVITSFENALKNAQPL